MKLLLTITSSIMTKWFSGKIRRCKEILSLWFFAFMKIFEKVIFGALTCILALGGSIIGTIAGAIKGHTTEVGFLDGASKGAIAGAIAAIEFIDFSILRQPFSKVVLLNSLLNGKIFVEWICPAVAQAYLFYINTSEASYELGVSDFYDIKGIKGMPQNVIQNLDFYQFNFQKMMKSYNESCCSICFQDFEDGELVRILPKCCHHFHLECIDKWLVQQGSCPMCRTYVLDHIHD